VFSRACGAGRQMSICRLSFGAMSELYLVRHGQGSFGSGNYDKLSELGCEQSTLVGQHFAEMGIKLDALYAGTLVRQHETAELLARAYAGEAGTPLPVINEPAFNEYDGDAILKHYAASLAPAELERLGFPGLLRERSKFQLFLERAARAWVEGTLVEASILPWIDFHARIAAALSRLMREHGRGKTVAVCTSGGVIGTTVAHVLGLRNHTGIELNWAVHNASITRLIYSGERVSLSMFNALPHFERPERKRLITFR
jgi:broad specificity phosphatase PhoE